jgi:hypothetical protein
MAPGGRGAASGAVPDPGRRALPNTTIVDSIWCSASSSSGFHSSSWSRTGRSSSRSRKSGSAKARRYDGERVCGVSGSRAARRRSSPAEGSGSSGWSLRLSTAFLLSPWRLFIAGAAGRFTSGGRVC